MLKLGVVGLMYCLCDVIPNPKSKPNPLTNQKGGSPVTYRMGTKENLGVRLSATRSLCDSYCQNHNMENIFVEAIRKTRLLQETVKEIKEQCDRHFQRSLTKLHQRCTVLKQHTMTKRVRDQIDQRYRHRLTQLSNQYRHHRKQIKECCRLMVISIITEMKNKLDELLAAEQRLPLKKRRYRYPY